ncbi:unnamed protein product [Chrysoparadoxa australica]
MGEDLAAKAHARFAAGDYEGALEWLGKVKEEGRQQAGKDSREDLRVLHNEALSQYGKGGFEDTREVKASLDRIKGKMRARSVGKDKDEGADETEQEHLQQAGHGGATVGLLGSSGSAAAAAADLADLDTDASILLYNLSALHFQQKQYGAARAILEHLFLHIEPLDEPLASHICFLLLDVLCHTARGSLHTEGDCKQFAQQSTAVLNYLERPHGHFSAAGAGAGVSGDKEKERGEEKESDAAAAAAAAADSHDQTEFLFRLHLYKAKVLLLLKDVKRCKKEVKGALEIFQRQLRGGDEGQNAEAQSHNAFSPVPPHGVQNMTALYLKANLEYLRENHRKALKLLASCHGIQGSEDYVGPCAPVGPLFYNNMGCLHHKLRRFQVALHYFRKALQAIGEGMTNGGPLACGAEAADGRVVPSVACETLYNTGLQLLLTDAPEEALRCFEKSALLFYNRPYVWLRLAECCIKHHRQTKTSVGEGELVRGTVGQGLHRRVLLHADSEDNRLNGVHSSPPAPPGTGDSPAAKCSLPYASHCLQNVLHLCAAGKQADRAAAEGTRDLGGVPVSMLGVSPRITAKHLEAKDKAAQAAAAQAAEDPLLDGSDHAACQAALLDLCYVHLSMQDPVPALAFAERLLAIPSIPAISRHMAHVYAAECMCMTGRAQDALKHLEPLKEEDAALILNKPPQSEQQAKEEGILAQLAKKEAANTARSSLHINLATVHMLQGNLQQAERCMMNALRISPTCPQVLRMLVYILLRRGNIAEARQVLREGRYPATVAR